MKPKTAKPTGNLVLAALFLGLGLILPFLTMQIPQLGSRLLPMHIPVLLCGFLCGPYTGVLVGFITPLFRSMLFNMPVMFPTAATMAFELAAYGLFSGMLYKTLNRKSHSIYIALILSMLCGRIVWGAANYILLGLDRTTFTWGLFVSGAFLNAIPGIIIQLLLIPPIVIAAERQLRKDELYR